MLTSTFTKVALAVAVACGAIAKPALDVPPPGTYRIQNIGSGLFWDANGSLQDPGTAVISFNLNTPLSINQEWNLTFSGSTANIQSISSFVASDIVGNDTALALFPGVAGGFNISSAPGGVFICAITTPVTCATSPATSSNTSQILLQPFTGAANQTWVFEIVGI